MAYDPGAIDQALSAAVGDDPALIAELRAAFSHSARTALDAIALARDAEQWSERLLKLRGLAASFGAVRLAALAGEALDAPVGDARALRLLRRNVERL
ncbi:Hpt domain-containing protein [Sphingomonas sp.]|uniref:Hpt domain-containing protein n=1 Tax=Sphingomonas sp. TaxID=28214 RepID=UPI0035C7EA76